MIDIKKFKLLILLLLIYSCKLPIQEDCEDKHKDQITYSCFIGNQEGYELCILDLITYNRCKKDNAKLYPNKIEFQ